MSGGRKPDLTIKTKPVKDGGGAITLGCWWREDGKLRGGFDKRVRRMSFIVENQDGSTSRVDAIRGLDGKMTHYLNAWEEAPTVAPPKRAAAADAPPPDFGGDDDIPF